MGSKALLGWLHPGTARGVTAGVLWDVHRDGGNVPLSCWISCFPFGSGTKEPAGGRMDISSRASRSFFQLREMGSDKSLGAFCRGRRCSRPLSIPQGHIPCRRACPGAAASPAQRIPFPGRDVLLQPARRGMCVGPWKGPSGLGAPRCAEILCLQPGVLGLAPEKCG